MVSAKNNPRRADNVFFGPSSLKDYYNPDHHPPLPLVELPEYLNPFYHDGVRIFAKMMTMLPAHNVKALPALAMLSSEEVVSEKTRTVVEYSSGSTIISMSIISRVLHGIYDVRAFLSNKTSENKLRLMQFFGLDITLFGGPSQPEPCDERGGIQQARNIAEEHEQVANPNQYENDRNWQAHFRWTGPQILDQLPDISIMCAGMGTSGTMTGIGKYLKQEKPSVVNLAVCTAPGERVPGPRSFALMDPVKFPWQDAVDQIVEVGANDSYSMSLQLCREGLICGPSSGFNLKGLFDFLKLQKQNDILCKLRGPDGMVNCAFICCDLPYQYVDEYFAKLDSSYFKPIRDQILSKADLYRYDEAWELGIEDAVHYVYEAIGKPLVPWEYGAAQFHPNRRTNLRLKADSILLDLRQLHKSTEQHVALAERVPLCTLDSGSPSPFYDAATLERQWKELDALYGPTSHPEGPKVAGTLLRGKRVFLLCCGGDTSRICSSVMRANGVEAYSIAGGLRSMQECCPQLVYNGSVK